MPCKAVVGISNNIKTFWHTLCIHNWWSQLSFPFLEQSVVEFFLSTPLPPSSHNSLIGLDRGELRVISTQGPQGRYLMKQNLLKAILEVG